MAGQFLQRSRHGTMYFFRRRVPDDLRDVVGHQQLYKSLGTQVRRDAIVRARALATHTDRMFAELRSMPKHKRHTIKTEYVLSLDMDELGRPQLRLQTEAHDSPEDKDKALQAFAQAASAAIGDRSTAPAGGPVVAAGNSTKTMKDAVAEYLAGSDRKPSTLKTYRTALENQALPYFGEKEEMGKVKQLQLAQFVNHLNDNFPSRSVATKAGYIHALTGMFKWHKARGEIVDDISSATLMPTQDRPDAHARDLFSLPQLSTLFANAHRYIASEPAKFWVTVGIAFTGCRLEELAQVNLQTDLRHDADSDIWYLILNQEPDRDGRVQKSLKRHSAWRVAPIHTSLVKHGFLAYLLAARDVHDNARPFEAQWSPRRADNLTKWSVYISKWGQRELEHLISVGAIGGGAKLTYFHSMRHTIANTLARRGVTEEYRAALCGQLYGSVNAKTYAKLAGDHTTLAKLVEDNLGEYAAMLDATMAASAV